MSFRVSFANFWLSIWPHHIKLVVATPTQCGYQNKFLTKLLPAPYLQTIAFHVKSSFIWTFRWLLLWWRWGWGSMCRALHESYPPIPLTHNTPAPIARYIKWARRTFYFIKDAICKITYLRRIPPWFALYRLRRIPNASKLRWNSILSPMWGRERLVLIVANTTDSFEVEIRLS